MGNKKNTGKVEQEEVRVKSRCWRDDRRMKRCGKGMMKGGDMRICNTGKWRKEKVVLMKRPVRVYHAVHLVCLCMCVRTSHPELVPDGPQLYEHKIPHPAVRVWCVCVTLVSNWRTSPLMRWEHVETTVTWGLVSVCVCALKPSSHFKYHHIYSIKHIPQPYDVLWWTSKCLFTVMHYFIGCLVPNILNQATFQFWQM